MTRSLIAFRQLNLLEPLAVPRPVRRDLLPNVMIYFDGPTKTALVDRFTKKLKPGGWLYIGHSESLLGSHPGLQADGPNHLSEGRVSATPRRNRIRRRRAEACAAKGGRRFFDAVQRQSWMVKVFPGEFT